MATRAAQKEATRKRVLHAAQACFAEEGIEACTIAKVAKRAGVSVGSVMAHYADKATLILAAFETQLARILREAQDTLPTDVDVVDQLVHPARLLYAWYGEDLDNARVLVRSSLFLGGARGASLDQYMWDFLATQAAHLGAAVAAGTLAEDTPVELITQGFFADYMGVLIGLISGFVPTPDAAATQLHALTALRLQGLRA